MWSYQRSPPQLGKRFASSNRNGVAAGGRLGSEAVLKQFERKNMRYRLKQNPKLDSVTTIQEGQEFVDDPGEHFKEQFFQRKSGNIFMYCMSLCYLPSVSSRDLLKK